MARATGALSVLGIGQAPPDSSPRTIAGGHCALYGGRRDMGQQRVLFP
jgi:hypothetical protein